MSDKVYSPLTVDNLENKYYNSKHIKSYAKKVIIGAAIIITYFAVSAYKNNTSSEEPHHNTSSTKTPAIAWYTPMGRFGGLSLYFVEARTISCPVNNSAVTCDIFSKNDFEGKADAYIFYGTFIKEWPKRDSSMLWGLVHEETPKNTLPLMHEKALNLFNFSATFSRFSDVPMPLYWIGSTENIVSTQYFVKTSLKNNMLYWTYKTGYSGARARLFRLRRALIAPVLYIQTTCDSFTERDEFVDRLMELIPVDSYGLCLNNKQFPNTDFYKHLNENKGRLYLIYLNDDEILHFIARYKFIVAIENAVCNDYVTEKLWRAIHVGIVPIYYGSPLVKDWLPNPKSAILLEDFPTPELLSKHLYDLLNNDTKYEEYLEHKTKGVITNFRVFQELESRPYQTSLSSSIDKLYCVMCERLHESSERVNTVSKKHYDCRMPTPAFNISIKPSKLWSTRIKLAKNIVNKIYST